MTCLAESTSDCFGKRGARHEEKFASSDIQWAGATASTATSSSIAGLCAPCVDAEAPVAMTELGYWQAGRQNAFKGSFRSWVLTPRARWS